MRGSVRERRPGVWQVRIHAERGSEISRTVRGKRADADKAMRDLIAEYESKEIKADPGTLGELLDRWLDQSLAMGRRGAAITLADRGQIDLHLKPLLAMPVRRVTTGVIDAHYTRMRAAGASPQTVFRIHKILGAAFRYAERQGAVATSPTRNASPPKVPKSRAAAVEIDALRAALEHFEAANPEIATLMMLAALTGLRRGELCGLQWRDIDFAAHELHVRRHVVVAPFAVLEGAKTGDGRRVALSSAAIAVLQHHWARRRAKAASMRVPPRAWVFATRENESGKLPPRPDWVTRTLGAWTRSHPDMPIRAHGLRHLYATLALRDGSDVAAVSAQLGHSRRSTTLDTYAHALPAAGRAAAEVVAGALGMSSVSSDVG